MAELPLSFDYGYLAPDVDLEQVKAFQDNVDLAHKKVTQGGGLGADYLGWVDPGKIVSADEITTVKDLAKRIQDNSDALVAIGIGGSYLGARAVIEAVGEGHGPEVLFAGNSLSAHEQSAQGC
jgi:glucose-6-phosphate isomerase